MSLNEINLCIVTLKQDFGEVVEKVGVYLLKKGSSPLRVLSQETCLQIKQVPWNYLLDASQHVLSISLV